MTSYFLEALFSDMANQFVVQDEINCQPIEKQQIEHHSLVEVECPPCRLTFPLQNSNITPLQHVPIGQVKGRSVEGRENLEQMGGKASERWKRVFKTIKERKKLPRVGDQVLAMWSESKWEYFGATVTR